MFETGQVCVRSKSVFRSWEIWKSRELIPIAEIIVAKHAGFCFGVRRAVDTASSAAPAVTLGPIIHNPQMVEMLRRQGVVSVDGPHAIPPGARVVIRSHGVGRREFEDLLSRDCTVLDATCPFVLKIHRIVEKESKLGNTIIIIGNENHPEVMGIKGWSGDKTYVIGSVSEAKNFDLDVKNLVIVSQTTFNYKKFQEIVEIFEKKRYDIRCLNTICNATEERQTEAREIAKKVDAMIVIGGKNSSNTQKLFEICKEECDNTYYIQIADDMDFSTIRGMQQIGITAGASTPKKIIEEVQTRCQS